MRRLLKSTLGLLLTALLFAWSVLCGAGALTQCAGDASGPCRDGAVHAVASLTANPAQDFCCQDSPPSQPADCGCPLDHQHYAISFDLIPSVQLHAATPLLAEIFVCPLPPVRTWQALHRQKPGTFPERIPPASAPPHLACGPMLI